MKTFKDYLESYNNLDVILFAEAVEKMKLFYQEKIWIFLRWCFITRFSFKIFNEIHNFFIF